MAYIAQQLADREAIREVAHRYSRGVDRLDGEVMKSAYWPDAIDDHGVFVGNAHEFADHCMTSHTRFRATMHCIFNHHIELGADGVHATGEVYNVSYLFAAEGNGVHTWWGRYLDRYEQRDGEWRIAHRVCVHEGDQSGSDSPSMQIDSASFRQGSFDRPAHGRPIGP